MRYRNFFIVHHLLCFLFSHVVVQGTTLFNNDVLHPLLTKKTSCWRDWRDNATANEVLQSLQSRKIRHWKNVQHYRVSSFSPTSSTLVLRTNSSRRNPTRPTTSLVSFTIARLGRKSPTSSELKRSLETSLPHSAHSRHHRTINHQQPKERKHPLFPGAVPVQTTESPDTSKTCGISDISGINGISDIRNNTNGMDDIQIFIHQTNQSAPSKAILGKPLVTHCQHGFPQAFSLDPMPPPEKFQRSTTSRINSGLLKLTCPLLVGTLDVLEDEGFMKLLNKRLASETQSGDGEVMGTTWMESMEDAHRVHSTIRKKLIFGHDNEPTEKEMNDNPTKSNPIPTREKANAISPLEKLTSKLGARGATSFLDAGVAGASPSATTPDVKCLHAWLADYLFRKVDVDSIDGAGNHDTAEKNNGSDCDFDCSSGSSKDGTWFSTGASMKVASHPIGEAIVQALSSKGVDVSGNDNCHRVCSGQCYSITSVTSITNGEIIDKSNGSSMEDDCISPVSVSVSVPIPRNKQRKKRGKEMERRRRRKLEDRSSD